MTLFPTLLYNTHMKCPRCENKVLCEFENEGVDFDFCDQGCHGVWSDHGELAYYLETEKDLPKSRDFESDGIGSEMACPRCETQTMIEISYLPDQGPDIDLCTKCGGIWMDFKELGEIQKLAAHLDNGGKIERVIKSLFAQLKSRSR